MGKSRRNDNWLLPAVLAGLTLTNWFMLVAVGFILGLMFLCCDRRPRMRFAGAAALAVPAAVGWLTMEPISLTFAVAASLAGMFILRSNLFSSVTSGALLASLAGVLAVLALFASGGVGLESWSNLETQAATIQKQWGLVAGDDVQSRLAVERTVRMVVTLLPSQYVLMMLASFFISALAFRRWGEAAIPLSLGCTRFDQYRFEDHWVWAVIAGLVLVLLAGKGWPARLALNLLFVMGVLYVIRGLAVMFFFIAARGGGLIIRLLAVTLCLTPVCLFHLTFGLLDTWMDFRRTVPEQH